VLEVVRALEEERKCKESISQATRKIKKIDNKRN
jgi:hypothetical protein